MRHGGFASRSACLFCQTVEIPLGSTHHLHSSTSNPTHNFTSSAAIEGGFPEMASRSRYRYIREIPDSEDERSLPTQAKFIAKAGRTAQELDMSEEDLGDEVESDIQDVIVVNVGNTNVPPFRGGSPRDQTIPMTAHDAKIAVDASKPSARPARRDAQRAQRRIQELYGDFPELESETFAHKDIDSSADEDYDAQSGEDSSESDHEIEDDDVSDELENSSENSSTAVRVVTKKRKSTQITTPPAKSIKTSAGESVRRDITRKTVFGRDITAEGPRGTTEASVTLHKHRNLRDRRVTAQTQAGDTPQVDQRELDRLLAEIARVNLLVRRKATPLPAEPKSSMTLFSSPKRRDRNFRAKLEVFDGAKGQLWSFCTQPFRFIGAIPKHLITRSTALAVNTEYADIMNCWPGHIDTISSEDTGFHRNAAYTGMPRQILGILLRKYGLAWQIPAPYFSIVKSTWKGKSKDIPVIICKIDYINSTDFSRKMTVVKLSPSQCLFEEAPRVTGVEMVRRPKIGFHPDKIYSPASDNRGDGIWESDVPSDLGWFESSRTGLENAERLLRAVAIRMSNKIVDPTKFSQIAASYTKQWGRKFRNDIPCYDNVALFYVQRRVHHRTLWLRPSNRLRDDTKDVFPLIIIDSVDMSRALSTITRTIRQLEESNDAKAAWSEAATAAIHTQLDISRNTPPPSRCDCPDQNTMNIANHPCGWCGRDTVCTQLVMTRYGVRACRSCTADPAEFAVGLPEIIAVSSLSKMYRHDMKKEGISLRDSVARNILDDAKLEVQHHFSMTDGSLRWLAGYTSLVLELSNEGTGRVGVVDALLISADAAWPYLMVLTSRGWQIFRHCKGNIRMIPWALNALKHTWFPGWLKLVSDFFLLQEDVAVGKADQQTLATATTDLIQRATDVRIVRVKARMQQRMRVGRSLCWERMQLDLEEWRACRPRPDEHGAFEQKMYHAKTPGYAGFFGLPGTMPSTWGWPLCSRILHHRFGFMTQFCNGRDPTDDTDDTIFIEIIFQVCVRACNLDDDLTVNGKYWSHDDKLEMKVQYREFLGLPLKAELVDPLCFSIGHRLHGQQMRSSWTGLASLDDCDWRNNNMLVEIKSSNLFKSNFETKQYPDLYHLIRNVDLSKDLADFELHFSPVPAHLQDDWSRKKAEPIDFEDGELLPPTMSDDIGEEDEE
ncbi:Hypothetical protein D9617_35g089670 [Elsinoe fawcettii]|nr:Hypothetical protein D9617_35g089670 [Elsinoe fawcettii]